MYKNDELEVKMESKLKKNNLIESWAIVVKRRWLGIVICVIITSITLILSILQKPIYRATAEILVESETPQVVKVDDVTTTDPRGQDYYQTQYKILESRSIAREVIKRLALETSDELTENPFYGQILFSLSSMINTTTNKNNDDETDPLDPYITEYLNRININPVPKSRLIRISYDGYDRGSVAKIANEHANAYVNLTLSFRLTGSKDAATWLMGQTEKLKETLRQSENRLQVFTKANDMLALETMLSSAVPDQRGFQYNERGGSSEANFISQRLTELNTQVSVIRNERIANETLYKQIKGLSINPEAIESIPEISNNLLIQKLKGDYVGLQRQLSDMRERYGEKHPKMIALKDETSSLLNKIKIEIAKIARGVELQYEVSIAKEKNIEKDMETLKKNASILNEKLVQYLDLRSDVELNRDLYNKVLKRAKETALTSGLSATNVVIVDQAETPVRPVKPRIFINTILSLIIGILLGIIGIFIYDYLDGAIDNPEQVEKLVDLPCMGAIIELKNDDKNNRIDVIKSICDEENTNFVESVRSTLTNIIFSISKQNNISLLVSSSIPEEGKSTISVAFSAILSGMGKKTIVLDCDFRKPSLHKIFEEKINPGVSDVLLGKNNLTESIIKTKIPNLWFLSAGTINRNTMQLVSSVQFKSLIIELQKTFDIVVIDTSPIIAVSDAQFIFKQTDYAVVVVNAGSTHRRLVKQTVKNLVKVSPNVLGIVLNKVDINKDKLYYGHYYKYYDYYNKKEI